MTTPSRISKGIPFKDFAADMARRYEEAGRPEVPRNSGNRRTESKRALLKAIKEAGGTW